jgi:hypothetical protein
LSATQKSAVITSDLEATFRSATFQKLHPVLKFSFKPPDGIPRVHEPPKLNVYFAVSSVKVYGPLFIAKPTQTGINLYTLENSLMPQLQQDKDREFIFQ